VFSAVFKLLLGPLCKLLDVVRSSMMKCFDSAIQVSEKLDTQFVANIQYKASMLDCFFTQSVSYAHWRH